MHTISLHTPKVIAEKHRVMIYAQFFMIGFAQNACPTTAIPCCK